MSDVGGYGKDHLHILFSGDVVQMDGYGSVWKAGVFFRVMESS